MACAGRRMGDPGRQAGWDPVGRRCTGEWVRPRLGVPGSGRAAVSSDFTLWPYEFWTLNGEKKEKLDVII